MSSRARAPRRGILRNVRPSYLILLTALPFVIYLFVSNERYQAALEFLLPGLGTTALVTVVAYVVASALGLLLAGLQMLKLGDHTVRNAVFKPRIACGHFSAQLLRVIRNVVEPHLHLIEAKVKMMKHPIK